LLAWEPFGLGNVEFNLISLPLNPVHSTLSESRRSQPAFPSSVAGLLRTPSAIAFGVGRGRALYELRRGSPCLFYPAASMAGSSLLQAAGYSGEGEQKTRKEVV